MQRCLRFLIERIIDSVDQVGRYVENMLEESGLMQRILSSENSLDLQSSIDLLHDCSNTSYPPRILDLCLSKRSSSLHVRMSKIKVETGKFAHIGLQSRICVASVNSPCVTWLEGFTEMIMFSFIQERSIGPSAWLPCAPQIVKICPLGEQLTSTL